VALRSRLLSDPGLLPPVVGGTDPPVRAVDLTSHVDALHGGLFGRAVLLVHGIGMIVGPVLCAQAMGFVGPAGLFWTLAAAAFVLMAYALLRQRLDPRSLDTQLEFDFGDDAGSRT